MYISHQDYTIRENGKDQSNLIALIKWNPKEHSLAVKDGILEYRKLPVGNVAMDTDTIRAVTNLVYETLTKLYDVTLRAKGQLTHYSPEAHIKMADCADTIKIFVSFWHAAHPNIEKVLATANAENASRGTLSRAFGNRDEIQRLQDIRDKIWNNKEKPREFSFKQHVGRNTSGLIISETIIKDETPAQKRYYRIEGAPYGSVSSYSFQRSRACGTALLAFEVYDAQFVANHTEQKISWSGKGPVVRVLHFPTTCNDRHEVHDCPVTRAHEIFKQLMDELNASEVAVHKEWNESAKIITRYRGGNPGYQLQAEHPFFVELAKPAKLP